jgi:hypothetical protein
VLRVPDERLCAALADNTGRAFGTW